MGSLAGPSPAMARTPFTPWPPSCEMRISLGPQKDREGQIRLEQYITIKLLGGFFCFYIVLYRSGLNGTPIHQAASHPQAACLRSEPPRKK